MFFSLLITIIIILATIFFFFYILLEQQPSFLELQELDRHERNHQEELSLQFQKTWGTSICIKKNQVRKRLFFLDESNLL